MSAASAAATSGIAVLPVRSGAERRRFIRFPWSVYRAIDAWVPPLISDFKKKLDTERNPFYQHAEIELFLARRGTDVGTVAAIIDHHYNSFHDERTGFFGFFEAVDDAAAFALDYSSYHSYLQVIDIAAVTPVEAYQQGVRAFLDGIRRTAPAPGFDAVLVPGDFEHRSRTQRLAHGVEIPDTIYRQIEGCAGKLDVPLGEDAVSASDAELYATA